MPGRSFTREFKLEIVRQLAIGVKHPAHVCREYGLADSVLSRWRKEYAERGEAAFAAKALLTETPSAEARIAELERFCGQLALEHAVRKKALQSVQTAQGAASQSVTPCSPPLRRLFRTSHSARSVAGSESVGVGTTLARRLRNAQHMMWRCGMRLNTASWYSLGTAIAG